MQSGTKQSYQCPQGWSAVTHSIMILLISLGLFVVLPVFLIPVFGLKLDIRDRTIISLFGTLTAEGVLFAFLLRWLKQNGKTIKDIGWNQPTTWTGIGLGLIFGIGYAAYTLSNPLIGANATEVSLFKMAGIVIGLVGAFVEEIVFRGFLITELGRIGVSTPKQVLVSGASFAIIHIGFDLAGVVLTFIMGIVMATSYILGKRSLTPCFISHALINVAIEPWLLVFVITAYSRIGHF